MNDPSISTDGKNGFFKPNTRCDHHRHPGQVGSYLAEIPLMKNYRVHGIVRDIHRLGQAAHLKHVVTLRRLDRES
ncbi:MAG: hypothetical protein U0905_09760 [Pirellulales bacterium]